MMARTEHSKKVQVCKIDFGGDIELFIARLRDEANRNQNLYDFYLEWEHGYEYSDLNLFGFRDETEAERSHRLKLANAKKQKAMEVAEKKASKELAEYNRLHKIYGGSDA